MTITAHVSNEGFADQLKVWIVDRSLYEQRVLHFASEPYSSRWDDVAEGVDVEPTFFLSDNAARSLLESLTRHYNGAEDTRALRRDYDSERSRVDGLIKVIGEHLK